MTKRKITKKKNPKNAHMAAKVIAAPTVQDTLHG